MSSPATQGRTAVPQEVGGLRLRQVRNFIEQVEPAQFDLVQMLLGALRGRLVMGAMLGALLAVVCAVIVFLSIVPVYQSQGLMRMVARESKILYADSDDARLRLFDSFVAAEVTYLSSRPVLERTLAKLQAREGVEFTGDVGDLAKILQVSSQKGLITITARSREPATASAIINSLIDSYGELRLEQSENLQGFRTRELTTREANLLQQLKNTDKLILEVGEEYGQDAIAKAHVNKISQIGEISGRIDELTSTINQIETVGYAMDADTGDIEIKRSMLLDNSMASMTYDRAKKAAEEASLAKRYRPGHAKLIAAQAEIAVLDKAIEERRAQIATLGRTGALTQREQKKEQSVDELRALLGKLQERRTALEADAMDLNSRIVRLGYLREERAQTRALLDETRRVLEEVRVESRNASPGITEVVARGSTPDRPFEDKRSAMALVALMAGFGMGFAAVAAWGILNPTVRSESDVAALGKSVALAGIFEDPDASAHKLRNTLQMAVSRHSDAPGRSVAVVGGAGRQGATTLTRVLAASFQQSGSCVAMVDGHLSNRGLTAALSAEDECGLSDWISSAKAMPLPLTQRDGITLLAAGRDENVTDHVLAARDAAQLIGSLAESHDVTLADCGAACQTLSALLFATHCDVVLLVLQRGLGLGEARSAVSAVLATTRKQVLVVLTGRPPDPVPDYLRKAAAKAVSKLKIIPQGRRTEK